MIINDTPHVALAHMSYQERVHYFSRQLITADDMTAEQEYFREKLRRHNRFLHGWGVVCGCEVTPVKNGTPREVQVSPGYVITPQGDEILIPEKVNFDLAGNWRQAHDPCAHVLPCPPVGKRPEGESQVVYLAVCYAECNTRPVRVHPAGCSCDEAACEYSRIRESFELVRLWELPKSHILADEADTKWIDQLREFKRNKGKPWPVPDCPDDSEDGCVVLATVKLLETPIAEGDIQYNHRRVLYSAVSLHGMMRTKI